MHHGLSEIRQFYQSSLGRLTARLLNEKIRLFIDADDDNGIDQDEAIIGIGYVLPYFEQWPQRRTIAVMSATQGAVRWPQHEPNRVVLTEDHILPFADQSVERIIMVHAVESADYLRELMDEVWRVLKPNGRVLLAVPNRSGIWTKTDRTPFGQGRSFNMKQIRSLLYDAQFVIEQDRRALYFFPSYNRVLLWLAPMLEKIGEKIVPRLGGVTLIDAGKRLYNVTPLRVAPAKVKIRTVKPEWVSEPVPT